MRRKAKPIIKSILSFSLTSIALATLSGYTAYAVTQHSSAIETLSMCSNDIYGPWVTHNGNSIVNITHCDSEKICGHALKFSNGKAYSEITASELPQLQTTIGKKILDGFQAKSDDKFSGQIHNPKNGKIYKSSLKISDDKQRLKVKGCLGPICESNSWTRPESCAPA